MWMVHSRLPATFQIVNATVALFSYLGMDSRALELVLVSSVGSHRHMLSARVLWFISQLRIALDQCGPSQPGHDAALPQHLPDRVHPCLRPQSAVARPSTSRHQYVRTGHCATKEEGGSGRGTLGSLHAVGMGSSNFHLLVVESCPVPPRPAPAPPRPGLTPALTVALHSPALTRAWNRPPQLRALIPRPYPPPSTAALNRAFNPPS